MTVIIYAGINSYLRGACAVVILHCLLTHAVQLSPLMARICSAVIGSIAVLLLFGAANGFLILAGVAGFSLLGQLKITLLWRVLIAVGALAGAFHLRLAGFDSLWFWWLYVFWLRPFTLLIEADSTWVKRGEGYGPYFASSFAYMVAPPFLFGPMALEWLTWREFNSRLEFAPNRELSRRGAYLCWLGLGFLAAGTLVKEHVWWMGTYAYDPQMLSQVHGKSMDHILAGLTFFSFTLWQMAGITALAAGAWNASGCSLRYDFNKPALSRNMLDFWRRYHFYAHDFLLQKIYWPVFLYCSRYLPGGVSIAIGLSVTILGAVTAVHVLNPIPMPEVPFSHSFTWEGSFKHSLWCLIFIAIGLAISALLARVARALWPRDPLQFPLRWLEVPVTLVFIGMFFYNTYAHEWMGWTNFQYLQSIIGWP